MRTLNDFSYETEDARGLAGAMVEHNNSERNASLTAAHSRIYGRDGQWWRVAWAIDENGHAVVCYWSRAGDDRKFGKE